MATKNEGKYHEELIRIQVEHKQTAWSAIICAQ